MTLAAVFAALLLCGCRREKPAVQFEERDGGVEPWAAVKVRKPSLPPPKARDALEPRPSGAASLTFVARAVSEKKRLAPPEPRAREPMKERYGGEPLRPEASAQASPGPAGPPPDEAEVQGDPEVREADELTPTPADRPQRYASPAPLKKVLSPLSIGDRRLEDVGPGAEAAVIDVAAAPAAFPPQRTAPLNDEVPDTVVADPSELGTYHVQVSSSPSFGAVLFNKEYPFMANIDLKADLMALDVRPGPYWIRYAIVDLLGFEHPFTRPQRIMLKKQPAR